MYKLAVLIAEAFEVVRFVPVKLKDSMKTVISYITKFLIGGEKADVLASLVGYTSDPNKFSRYRVVIIRPPFSGMKFTGQPSPYPNYHWKR